jgi:hypothetical protein
LHTPAEQTSLAVHAMLQPPQCCTLAWVSTQASVHDVRPSWHWQPEAPAQTSPVTQITPQVPQFATSVSRLAHTPLQLV